MVLKMEMSLVGRAQDVPDVHRDEPGKWRATLRFCPTYEATSSVVAEATTRTARAFFGLA